MRMKWRAIVTLVNMARDICMNELDKNPPFKALAVYIHYVITPWAFLLLNDNITKKIFNVFHISVHVFGDNKKKHIKKSQFLSTPFTIIKYKIIKSFMFLYVFSEC